MIIAKLSHYLRCLQRHAIEGDSPVLGREISCTALVAYESRSLGVERKKGGNLHPWLNIDERSIANKYPEGKLKSTSKGELKDLKSLRGKRLFVTHVNPGSQFTEDSLSLPDITVCLFEFQLGGR